jgi:hypothetical protein
MTRVRSAILSCAVVASVSCAPTKQMNFGGPDGPGSGSGTHDGGTDGAGPDGPSATAACASLAEAKCTKLMTCSMTDLERKYGTLTTCESREALACNDAQMAPATAAMPAQAEACGSALTAETCAAFLSATAPAECLPPDGPGAGGCAFGGQCAQGYCALGAEALCGECRPQPTVGTSCAAADCANGQVCAPGNSLCADPGASGASCDENAPCGDGFTCVGTTKTAPGHCQPEITTLGAACDALHNTRADCSADDGLACNTTTAKCVALGLAGSGGQCGVVADVRTECTDGAQCFIPTNQTVGTCSGPAADGSACNSATGPDCLTPARCIPPGGSGTAGTCQLPGSMSCS